MDKLKPILAQKFWILAGLCLILPLTGWWMATAGLAKEIDERRKTIEAAFTGIPQPGPNDNWTNRVKKFNEEEDRKVKETGDYLWNNQLQYMTWPEKVREGVERAGLDGDIDAKTRGDYRYEYDKEIQDTLNLVSPYNPEDGSGLVDASIDLIPNAGWGTSQIPPSSKEMRESQEDIWLYRALFQAVANINTNQLTQSTSIVDSKIKQISILELRGGTVGGAKAAGAPTSGSAAMPGGSAAMPPGGAAAMPPGGPGNPMSQMGGRGLDGMGATGGSDALAASFDPAEQFGPDDDTTAAAGTPNAAAGAAMPPGGPAGPGAGPMAMPPGGPGKMGMGMQGGGSNVPRKRYIEETPRYKTRGFYMEVVMDHRNLPEFIAELSDSGWPLRVIRIQAVDRDLSDIDSGVVGTGVGGMTSGGGLMKGMTSMGAMRGGMTPRPPTGRGSADMDDMEQRVPTRMARPSAIGGESSSGVLGEGVVSVDAAMADPYLVNVALSGIITLYLPPTAVGGAATPGAPANTATTAPAAATPAAASPAAGTAPATTPDSAASATTATNADQPAVPAEGTKPAAPAADDTKPAEDSPKPAAETPATPPTATPPAADTKTPAPAGTPPAGTTEKPAGTK